MIIIATTTQSRRTIHINNFLIKYQSLELYTIILIKNFEIRLGR